ncbi:EAL domain-containing protein [Marinomonas ostreistagni]|uniref:EAL domain-containing protein n=1 Tax=Marinomonas ostreistagni TaxID=359209 RepID=A0ABS0Z979_9GAMM|nr:EAL domain-containing protein [Marinomonas ostreistagni]MBJ7550214.1 EAL domain-containing protein [Marinomonas ostreistagni]
MRIGLSCIVYLFAITHALAAEDSIRLQLKWQHAYQFAGYYAAQELGLYDQVGLDVEIIPASPHTDVAEEVASGRAQYGVGNSSILIQRDNGLPLTILAVVFQHSPTIFIAKNNVITFHNWNKKNIMLEGSSDELLLYLEQQGLDVSTLNFIPHSFDPLDLTTDQVDIMSAYSTNEPFFLSQLGIPYRVFSPRSEGIDFFGDNLFTSDQELKDHPERVKAFRKASLEGWEYALKHPEKVISWIISRYHSTYSREFLFFEAETTYDLIQPDLIEVGYINEPRWHKVVKSYQALGKLSSDFDVKQALYLPEPETDWRQVWLIASISIPVMLLLFIMVMVIARTNRRLDHALKDSQKARLMANQQADLDPLTELSNRRYFQRQLEFLCKRAARKKIAFALFYIDLDHFKEINDLHGHHEGDNILKEVAQRIQSVLPEHCELARIGGDEFTILVKIMDQEAILDRLSQLILDVLKEPFFIAQEQRRISASIGITVSPRDSTTPSSLLQFADEAMYSAKNSGRNRWQLFSPSLHTEILERQTLLQDLRGALTNNELFVVYQPIVELSTRRICKVEALLRWQHKTRGLIGPDVFIPMAEESGLITSLGDFVFKESVKQLSQWRSTVAPELIVSINTSTYQYNESGKYLNHWYQYIEQMEVPFDAIILEITESMLMHQHENVSKQLLTFRDHGIHVALDDFGTGYSSLAYLNQLDIDFIKIDKSFIRDLDTGKSAQDLCEAIISMAHKLGLQVIAEGIETESQLSFLTSFQCDMGQGYLYAKPLPVKELTTLLAEKNI